MAGEARRMRAVIEAKFVGEFRNERSDKFWWKSVVHLSWARGEAVHDTPHVFVSLYVGL